MMLKASILSLNIFISSTGLDLMIHGTRNNKPHSIKHLHPIIYDNWFLYPCTLVRPYISSSVRNSHVTTTFSCYDLKRQKARNLNPQLQQPSTCPILSTTRHLLILYNPPRSPQNQTRFKNRTIGP
jgi:hypothetical protein